MDNKTAFHEALFKCLSMFYLYEERSVTALGCSPAANTNLCVHFKTKQLPRLIKTLHLRHFSTIEEQVSHFFYNLLPFMAENSGLQNKARLMIVDFATK